MKKILVIEDEKMQRDMIQLALHGYEVTPCPHTDEGLSLINDPAKRFDLVMTDFNNPLPAGGLRIAAAMCKSRPDVPLIAMTGDNLEEVRARYEAANPADGYLQKPFLLSELISLVKKLTDPELVATV